MGSGARLMAPASTIAGLLSAAFVASTGTADAAQTIPYAAWGSFVETDPVARCYGFLPSLEQPLRKENVPDTVEVDDATYTRLSYGAAADALLATRVITDDPRWLDAALTVERDGDAVSFLQQTGGWIDRGFVVARGALPGIVRGASTFPQRVSRAFPPRLIPKTPDDLGCGMHELLVMDEKFPQRQSYLVFIFRAGSLVAAAEVDNL